VRLLALALALAIFLAGCASSDGIGFARDDVAPDPYYKEQRELLAGEHHKVFEVPVLDGARILDVVAALEARSNGLPLPDAAPARLRVALLAPDGAELGFLELDAQRATGNLTVVTPAAGIYLVRVDGFGASQPVEGEEYGASYRLVSEVVY